MSGSRTINAVIRALNVINTAISTHGDQCPWKDIIEVARRQPAGEKLVVAVADDRSAGADEEFFEIQLRNDLLSLTPSDNSAEHQMPGAADWHVTTRFLDDLASRAQYYVDHPGRIGLAWLTDRMGIASHG